MGCVPVCAAHGYRSVHFCTSGHVQFCANSALLCIFCTFVQIRAHASLTPFLGASPPKKGEKCAFCKKRHIFIGGTPWKLVKNSLSAYLPWIWRKCTFLVQIRNSCEVSTWWIIFTPFSKVSFLAHFLKIGVFWGKSVLLTPFWLKKLVKNDENWSLF